MDVEKIRIEDDTVLDIADAAMRNMTSDVYDNTATYAVGDYCIYNNTLYVCNTAIETAESWNSSHWTETTISDEFSELNSKLVDYFDIEITIPASNVADTYSVTFPNGHIQPDTNYSVVVENLGGNVAYIGVFTLNTGTIATTGFGGVVKNIGAGANASASRPVRVYIYRK